MTPTAKEAQPPDRKDGVKTSALLPVGLFALSLMPFATVHAGYRLALGGLAGLLGLGLALRRHASAPRYARVAFGLGALAWLGAASFALPLGPAERATLQPGLASALDRALAIAGTSTHPLALDPWTALMEWGLVGALLALAAGTAAVHDALESVRRSAWALVGLGMLVLAIAAVHRGEGAPSIWWISGVPSFERDPFFAPFVSPNHAGACLAALSGVALGLVAASVGRARWLAAAIWIWLILGVVASGSRGAALDAVAAAAVVATIAGGRPGRAAVGLGALGALGALALAGPERVALWLTREITPQLYDTIEAGYGDVTTGRWQGWTDTLAMIRDAPWLGVGQASYGEAFPIYKSSPEFMSTTFAHQEVLQLVAEHGWPLAALTVLAVSALLGGALWTLGRAAPGPGRGLGAGLLAGIVALSVDCQVDFPMRIGALATLAAVLTGMLASLGADLGRPRRAIGAGAVAALALLATVAATLLVLAPPARSVWAPVEAAEDLGDLAISEAAQEQGQAQDDLVASGVAAYEEAVRRQPTRRQALQKLGRLRQINDDLEGARAALQAATGVDPSLPWPWRDLARNRTAAADFLGAMDAWRRMLWLDLPGDPMPYVREVFQDTSDLQGRAAFALPERADRWVQAARLAQDEGDQAAAEAFYRRAVELAPAAAIELAGALLRWGRVDEAAALLPKLEGSCRKAQVQAEIALTRQQLDLAREGFQAALRACGARDRRARLGLGRVRAAQGDPSGLRILEGLVQEDPTDTLALKALIKAHESLGHYTEASHYRELLEHPARGPAPDVEAPGR